MQIQAGDIKLRQALEKILCDLYGSAPLCDAEFTQRQGDAENQVDVIF